MTIYGLNIDGPGAANRIKSIIIHVQIQANRDELWWIKATFIVYRPSYIYIYKWCIAYYIWLLEMKW